MPFRDANESDLSYLRSISLKKKKKNKQTKGDHGFGMFVSCLKKNKPFLVKKKKKNNENMKNNF